jgi:hypothetical protein
MPDAFHVRAKDKATGKEVTFNVTRNSVIQTQQDAEDHVANMPGSHGGTHPGFDVNPAEAPAAEAKE